MALKTQKQIQEFLDKDRPRTVVRSRRGR